MTNTINNVPRELLERVLYLMDNYIGTTHAEEDELLALLSAPSPAGVDGWDVAGDILEKLSDAQAIIDGLRGEVAKINSDRLACWAEFKVMTRACLEAEKERDQQAQRIGELEGLLRHASKYIAPGAVLTLIKSTLSAGKEGE